MDVSALADHEEAFEDMTGRARVRDSDDLRAYYAEVDALDGRAAWTVLNSLEPDYPRSKSLPTLWRYSKIRPYLIRATELVSTEDAARRVFMLLNPALRDVSATCGHLFTGLQVMQPGEFAGAHQHTHAALRFVVEPGGGYTVVDGETIQVKRRDFLLTPAFSWHEHGVRADADEPLIWLDGLDFPLTLALESVFYKGMPGGRQPVTRKVEESRARFGVAGLIPADTRWDRPYSPLSYFPWEKSYEALMAYARVSDGSPTEGLAMDFVNPLTGGPVMPTIGARLQMLRPGARLKARRQTGSIIFHVAKGRGRSIIAGRLFDWEESDTFCVPRWALHEHSNASATEEAVLFSINEFPVMRSLGWWREEELEDNDGHQTLIEEPTR